MRKIFEKYKVFTFVALLSFVAVFFLCDSFKNTGHVNTHKHEKEVEHHASLTIALPQNQNSITSVEGVLGLDDFASLLGGLVVIQQTTLLSAIFLSLLLIGKLRNYLYWLLSRGILNPKLF